MPVVEAQVAGLMPRNPRTRAIPRKEFFQTRQDGHAATISADKTVPVIEKISDFDIEQCDLRGQGKRAIRDGRLLGLGCIEVGWDPYFGKQAIVERTIEPDETASTGKVKVKTHLRYQEYIRKASPYFRYRRAEDVLLPAFIQRAEDSPFVVLRTRRLLYEAVADPNYDLIKDKADLIAKAGIDWMKDDGYTASQQSDAMRNGIGRMCLEQHIWNRADGVYAVYIDGVDDPVRWGDWPYDMEAVDGFPLKLYIPLPSDNDPYGVAPMSYLVAAQQEKNRIRSKMSEMVAKWRNITLASNDAAPEELDRIKRAEEGSLVSVENPRNYLPMPATMDSLQHLLAYEQRIADDIRIQSNVSDYQLAGTGNSNFATDSALQAQAQSARREDDLVLVRKFLGDVVKFGFQLRQELMTTDQEVKITGEQAEWLKVSPEQIVGEYDFHLEVEEAPSDAQRARDDAKVLLEGFYGKPEVDGTEVMKRAATLLRQPTDIVKGVDQFAARREAEYENELLMSGTPAAQMIRPAPQENAQIHIQSHQEAIQRAQQAGQDSTPIEEHLQLTMEAAGLKEQNGGGKPPMVNKGTGQVKMSGQEGQATPTKRLMSGDVGALRGMAGAAG